MKLHPQARARLDAATAERPGPAPGAPGFDHRRLREYLRSRGAPTEPGPDYRPVRVGGVPCFLTGAGRSVPVVVYLHGGGWCLGSAAESEASCLALARRSGWAVLAVEYALAPEHPYPAAVEEVERVLGALPEAAGGLGIDASRIAFVGDSAGANLAAAAALRARDSGRAPWLLQCLLYPCVDLVDESPSRREFARGYGLEEHEVRWSIDAYTPDARDRERADVSPLRAPSLAGLPPALVITAGYDPLRDEGEAYAERLAQAGVPTVCVRYPDLPHGFADPDLFDAAEALFDQIGAMLRRLA